MKIWYFHNDSMLPEHGQLNRAFYIGKCLKDNGDDPVVFVGSNPHNTNIQLINNKNKYVVYRSEPFPWVVIKTIKYHGSRILRIFSMFEYCFRINSVSKNFEKPEVIIASSPQPLTPLFCIMLGKKLKVKTIVEIRDLWPESIVAYNILKENNILIKFLYKYEKYIYRKADAVYFVGKGLIDYIKDKDWQDDIDLNKIFSVSNGVDLDSFHYNKEKYEFYDKDLDNSDTFKIIYTGSIKKANNLGSLLDVAKKINNGKIVFLIWGDGNELEYLKQRVIDEKITNIVFKGKVDKMYIPSILCKADINLIHGPQTKLLKYGISYNKIYDYFASGKPIICDFNCKYNPILEYNVGEEVTNPNAENIAKTIEKFANLSKDEYDLYCKNAKIAAEKFDYKNITLDLKNIIEEILN